MNSTKTQNHFRPTQANIDLGALAHNARMSQSLAGSKVSLMAIIKANAYGHGAIQVAQTLEAEGIQALAVATPHEGWEIRQAGIRLPIFLLAGPLGAPGDFLVEQQLTPVLYNQSQIQALENTLSKPISAHLKIDTGMHRLGVLPQELSSLLKVFKTCKKIKLVGALSHLAQADTSFLGATEKQYKLFSEIEGQLKDHDSQIQIFHLANSAALLGKKLSHCNWARPGLMLYGCNPNPRFEEGKALKPVMHFATEIISLKQIPKGEAVSYGGDWTAARTSQVAVLPVGYADGYLRSLSNRGQVLVADQLAPIIGRVCMDLTMIDVTNIPKVKLGMPVTLWGPGLAVESVARWAGTISYELLCSVSGRVPRIYR